MTAKDSNDIITQAILSNINKIHTAIPGQFESFDGKLASVKPLIKKRYLDDTIETLPVITGVPVIFSSASDFQISHPIKKGDGCLIIFSERNISNWVKKGTDSVPAEPSKYDINDAIAIPGLFSPAVNKLEYDPDNVVIKYNEAIIKIQKDEKFAIGNPGAELLDILSRLLNTLKTDSAGGSPLAGAATYTQLAALVDQFLKGSI